MDRRAPTVIALFAGCVMSRIVYVLAVVAKDVVKHLLGVDGRRFGVKADGLKVAVDGVLPVAALAVVVAPSVVLVCS